MRYRKLLSLFILKINGCCGLCEYLFNPPRKPDLPPAEPMHEAIEIQPIQPVPVQTFDSEVQTEEIPDPNPTTNWNDVLASYNFKKLATHSDQAGIFFNQQEYEALALFLKEDAVNDGITLQDFLGQDSLLAIAYSDQQRFLVVKTEGELKLVLDLGIRIPPISPENEYPIYVEYFNQDRYDCVIQTTQELEPAKAYYQRLRDSFSSALKIADRYGFKKIGVYSKDDIHYMNRIRFDFVKSIICQSGYSKLNQIMKRAEYEPSRQIAVMQIKSDPGFYSCLVLLDYSGSSLDIKMIKSLGMPMKPNDFDNNPSTMFDAHYSYELPQDKIDKMEFTDNMSEAVGYVQKYQHYLDDLDRLHRSLIIKKEEDVELVPVFLHESGWRYYDGSLIDIAYLAIPNSEKVQCCNVIKLSGTNAEVFYYILGCSELDFNDPKCKKLRDSGVVKIERFAEPPKDTIWIAQEYFKKINQTIQGDEGETAPLAIELYATEPMRGRLTIMDAEVGGLRSMRQPWSPPDHEE